MIAKAKRKNYDFPYLHDETQRVAKAFGATKTPHVFVLKRTGDYFVVSYIGAIDNSARSAANADRKYVEDAVNALLVGESVSTNRTKAVGCGITGGTSEVAPPLQAIIAPTQTSVRGLNQ